MPLVKLPDGQIVNSDSVEAIRSDGDSLLETHGVTILMKGNRIVSMICDTEEEERNLLKKLAELLGVK